MSWVKLAKQIHVPGRILKRVQGEVSRPEKVLETVQS